MSASIHPSAFVDPGAKLGQGVTVGPCAVIENNVIIGDGCSIGGFASIKEFTRMGGDNVIHSYAMVGNVPQDLKFHGEESWLEMGDKNTVREFATLHRGTEGGGGLTRIGSGNLFMAYTHVAHDCNLGDGIVMSNAATLAGHVQVGDSAIIGGLSAVHQFARIGRNSFVGGMTGIARDLPPFTLAIGERAGISGLNLVGLRRLGVGMPTVNALKKAFHTIWLSGLNKEEALAQVEQEFSSIPEVMELVTFVRESPRGVLQATVKENGE